MTADGQFARRIRAAFFLAAGEVVAGLAVALAFHGPASAQFFDDRYPFFDFNRRQPRFFEQEPRPVDHSKPPSATPRKADVPAPLANILVLGDSTADWLAYGLEQKFEDRPEIGILRKARSFSGLIRYDARNDDLEWAQVARDLIAGEKPKIVIMMVGVQDRQAIRERVPPKPSGEQSTQDQKKTEPAADQKKSGASPDVKKAATADGDQQGREQPAIIAPEPRRMQTSKARPGSAHEYRSEKWEELYVKRIDDTIAALKSGGAPVLWVGLPAIRGARSTSDAAYLNDIYRSRAEKAGIIYVDVWDGFVDDNGRFVTQGPDFEGQIRRLRTSDGVHFTKAGAIKLAHFVDKELQRGILSRAIPVALPAPEEPQPQPLARPGAPAPRPLAGPVLYLTPAALPSEELLGGGGARQSVPDQVTTRVLVKGEPLTAEAGRADDFAWPPRMPNTTTKEALPPSGPPVEVSNTPPQAAGRTAQTNSGARVAGQPVLSDQIHPQSPPPLRRPAPWRSPPFFSSPGGFFGLFGR